MKELLSKENIDSTLRKVIIIITCLFPLSTEIQRIVPQLNKAIFALLILFLVIYFIKNRFKDKRNLIFLIIFFISYLISLFFTSKEQLLLNINMAIYLPFMYLFFIFFIENKEELKEDFNSLKTFIFGVIIVYTIILFISIFDGNCYTQIDSGGWGDSEYFISYSEDPNRIGPASMFIIILLTLLSVLNYYKKVLPLFVLPQLYVGYSGGSRTYFTLILATTVLFYYIWLDNKKYFWLSIIPLGIIFIIVLYNSSIITKITNLSNDPSNGRFLMWQERLTDYSNFPIINKLFGYGINRPRYIFNQWSHNDFIEILCCTGIVGLLEYIYFMFIFFKNLLKKNTSILVILIVIFIWLFNAVFNFFYVYFNAMISFPVLLLVVNKHYSNKEIL